MDCSFCKESAISQITRRVGKLPDPYDVDKDKTSLKVYRFCEQHDAELSKLLEPTEGDKMELEYVRERLATRRELGGAHDIDQDILEGMLEHIEQQGRKIKDLETEAEDRMNVTGQDS